MIRILPCDNADCPGALQCAACYLVAFARANNPHTALPRRSPEPCIPECDGWFVDGESYLIHRCDDCWADQGPLQLTDADYECHPVCVGARHALLMGVRVNG